MKKEVVYVIMAALLFSCGNGEHSTDMEIKNNVGSSGLKKLSEKRIYFGHQSVGYNILDGIRDVLKDFPDVNLNIVETSNPSEYKKVKGIFGHSQIGNNTDPKSKIDDFVKKINGGLGDVVDIAFFKLCYVDIDSHTDLEKVFSYYKTEMDKLEKKHPKVLFIHVTTPLTINGYVLRGTKQTIKHYIKSILRMNTGMNVNEADNIMRNRYNELLRKNFNNVIDLADFESISDDGKKCSFNANGQEYRQLVREYTTDGGHLNEAGRKIVAMKFINSIVHFK